MTAHARHLSVVPDDAPLRLAVPIVEDFAYLARRMRDDERAQFQALTGARQYEADVAARAMACVAGPVFGLVDQRGIPVMVGGFEPVRPGVFNLWAVGTMQGWADHWRKITRTCNRLLEEMLAGDAHRVQTVCLASRTRTHEWYERGVKLRSEGTRRGYFADGQDGIEFARVKGGNRV